MYGWVTLLYGRNYHNLVNYTAIKLKKEKKKKGLKDIARNSTAQGEIKSDHNQVQRKHRKY